MRATIFIQLLQITTNGNISLSRSLSLSKEGEERAFSKGLLTSLSKGALGPDPHAPQHTGL